MRLINDEFTREVMADIRANGPEWADGEVDWTDLVTGPGATFTDADFEDDERHDRRYQAIREFVISQL